MASFKRRLYDSSAVARMGAADPKATHAFVNSWPQSGLPHMHTGPEGELAAVRIFLWAALKTTECRGTSHRESGRVTKSHDVVEVEVGLTLNVRNRAAT